MLDLFGEADFELDVSGILRLEGHEDVVVAVSALMVNGEPFGGLTRSLTIYEKGRWLDHDCDAAHALVLGPDSQ